MIKIYENTKEILEDMNKTINLICTDTHIINKSYVIDRKNKEWILNALDSLDFIVNIEDSNYFNFVALVVTWVRPTIIKI